MDRGGNAIRQRLPLSQPDSRLSSAVAAKYPAQANAAAVSAQEAPESGNVEQAVALYDQGRYADAGAILQRPGPLEGPVDRVDRGDGDPGGHEQAMLLMIEPEARCLDDIQGCVDAFRVQVA